MGPPCPPPSPLLQTPRRPLRPRWPLLRRSRCPPHPLLCPPPCCRLPLHRRTKPVGPPRPPLRALRPRNPLRRRSRCPPHPPPRPLPRCRLLPLRLRSRPRGQPLPPHPPPIRRSCPTGHRPRALLPRTSPASRGTRTRTRPESSTTPRGLLRSPAPRTSISRSSLRGHALRSRVRLSPPTPPVLLTSRSVRWSSPPTRAPSARSTVPSPRRPAPSTPHTRRRGRPTVTGRHPPPRGWRAASGAARPPPQPNRPPPTSRCCAPSASPTATGRTSRTSSSKAAHPTTTRPSRATPSPSPSACSAATAAGSAAPRSPCSTTTAAKPRTPAPAPTGTAC